MFYERVFVKTLSLRRHQSQELNLETCFFLLGSFYSQAGLGGIRKFVFSTFPLNLYEHPVFYVVHKA